MVAYLSRCQLDPAMPRCSIETLLHAFVPAPHVHHTHPDGINVLAGTADGERLVRGVLRRRARPGSPTSAPASRSPSRSARRRAPTPDLKLVVLAKHGLVVWGDTRRGGLPAHDRGDQPGGRVRQRAHRRHRRASAAATRRRPTARAGLLRELLPAIRGAVSSERHKLLTVDTSRARARVRLLGRGRAARHGRRAVPRPPRPHQAAAAVDPLRPGRRRRRRAARADRRARGGVPRRLPRVRRRHATTRPSRPTPTRGSCWSSTSGWSPRGRRRRPRRSRATSTTARSR